MTTAKLTQRNIPRDDWVLTVLVDPSVRLDSWKRRTKVCCNYRNGNHNFFVALSLIGNPLVWIDKLDLAEAGFK